MRRPALAGLLAGAALPGCGSSSSTSCGFLIGCLNGVHVVLSDFATTYADDLPVTLEVCVGGSASCSAYRIETTGQGPVCSSVSGGTSTCTIDGMSTLVLSSLPLTGSPSTVSVEAKVTTSSKTLFDATEMATVTQSGDPACGTCIEASVAFTPTGG